VVAVEKSVPRQNPLKLLYLRAKKRFPVFAGKYNPNKSSAFSGKIFFGFMGAFNY
jgi:hypothetical protein